MSSDRYIENALVIFLKPHEKEETGQMPKFSIFLCGNSLYTVEGKDERSARSEMREWLGVRRLPAGTFVERRASAVEKDTQIILENNLRNGFSFEYS